VQLVFINGQPNLRFCETLKKPGYLVPVNSPEEADALARKACAAWPNKLKKTVEWPGEFFQKNAPGIVESAREAHPKSPWGTPGLGDAGDVSWMANAARESLKSRSDEVLSGWPQTPRQQRQQPMAQSTGGRTVLWLMGGTVFSLIAMRLLKRSDNVGT
jgi:hypothetical protein